MFQFTRFASQSYVFRLRYSLRSGFPHSDISGSKLHCQLPGAFRRLARPSSPDIAKASTTCTYSLDPITLSSLTRSAGYRSLICATPARQEPECLMQSQPYHSPLTRLTDRASVSDTTFFHFVKELTDFSLRSGVRFAESI